MNWLINSLSSSEAWLTLVFKANNFLARFFYLLLKIHKMQILREEKTGEIRGSAFKSPVSLNSFPAKPAKSLIRNENISWLICFGIVSFLTGMLKFLKVGVTMDTVTSVFFYSSLVGVSYFLYKIFSAPKISTRENAGSFHGLN